MTLRSSRGEERPQRRESGEEEEEEESNSSMEVKNELARKNHTIVKRRRGRGREREREKKAKERNCNSAEEETVINIEKLDWHTSSFPNGFFPVFRDTRGEAEREREEES